MIPLRDNISPSRIPIVNYTIIGVCTGVFLLQLSAPEHAADTLVERYGMIPRRVTQPDEPVTIRERFVVPTRFGGQLVEQERILPPPSFSPWWTLLTCVFLHGGWLHFLGNMWFLHIFGDNVEDRLGHLGFLVFYLASGTAASLVHLVTNFSSAIPTIGASGAIAGVMGAYIVLYPRAMVLTLVPILFLLEVFVIPAYVFLGVWFLIQFFQGTLAITSMEAGGVAWWAHIGGFVAGFLVVRQLMKWGWVHAPARTHLPNTDRFSHYRYSRRW